MTKILFQVKRTSLWNKASEELKKHQEFVTKVKQSLPDFLKDPYGDPFVSDEMREFTLNLGDSDNENEEDIDPADEEEIEQIKSALEEEDGSSKIFSQTSQQPPVPADLQTDSSPSKKKRPGRPSKKLKKDSSNETTTVVNGGLEENMVSSSSTEPRTASIGVQTPSKLLKDLLANKTTISKEELRQIKDKVCSYL